MRFIQAALSGLLLAIPFLEASYYYLIWIGFVPLLLAIRDLKLPEVFLYSNITGIIFAIISSYWIIDFLELSKGYKISSSILVSIIFWVYSAQLISLSICLFKWLKKITGIHDFILFPTIITTLFSLYPMLFNAHLGQTQSQFLTVLQPIDIFGTHGLDMIIAAVNILIFRIVISFQLGHRISIPLLSIYTTMLLTWFLYGWISLQEWNQKLDTYDLVRVGLVQPNEIPSLEKQAIYPGYSRSFPPEMAMTQKLGESGAEIVIWPEAQYKSYFDEPQVANAYHHQIDDLNTNLIFQDIARVNYPLKSDYQQLNSAIMITKEGQATNPYHKIKRIAFGEYIPFSEELPVIKEIIESYFGQFFNEITKGESFQIFNAEVTLINSVSEKLNIIPLICYETIFSKFVASSVKSAASSLANEKGDLLVGLSSDGWFGTTHLPYQHINASVLRSIENRLPLIHVINNGPSTVNLPSGEIIFQSKLNEAGGYIVDVPVNKDEIMSFYSKYPTLFIYTIYSLFLILLLYALFLRYVNPLNSTEENLQ